MAKSVEQVRPGPPVLNDYGKILKGPHYQPPRIAAVLAQVGHYG